MNKLEIPKYNFNFAPDEKTIEFTSFKSGKVQRHSTKFYWNFNSYNRALFKNPSLRLSDLTLITASIFLSDRLALRSQTWKRDLFLTIPVRDYSFWSQAQISQLLSDILYYLTEDNWFFKFTANDSENFQKSNQLTFPFGIPDETLIALFSGGLDSFAGIVKHLGKYDFSKSFLVSIVTNFRMRGVQKKLVNSIREELKIDVVHIPLAVHLRAPILAEHLQETSQRSRGFIFSVLGSIFAVIAKKSTINLFENGIGAINLPMVDFQIGTDNTRAVNPNTLVKISKLISLVIESSFEIHNPALWLTKGQLCETLLKSSLKNTISKTVSCDGGFSRRVKGKTHCGHCTSCILRRQALSAIGLSTDDVSYQIDIYQAESIRNENHILPLRAMQSQVRKLDQCLNAEKPWFELSKNFPLLEEILLDISNFSDKEIRLGQDNILQLYSNYINEWQQFEHQLN